MLWYSSGTVEPVEERTSDVNFSMGVASRGRIKLRSQLFFFFTFLASEQYLPHTWLH